MPPVYFEETDNTSAILLLTSNERLEAELFQGGVSSLLGGACLSAAPAEFTHAFSAAARPRPRRQVGGI